MVTPVPDRIAKHPDFADVFGSSAPHCALIRRTTNCQWVQVYQHQTGEIFDVKAWTGLRPGSHSVEGGSAEHELDGSSFAYNLPTSSATGKVAYWKGKTYRMPLTENASEVWDLVNPVLEEFMKQCAVSTAPLLWLSDELDALLKAQGGQCKLGDCDPFQHDVLMWASPQGDLHQRRASLGAWFQIVLLPNRSAFQVFQLIDQGRHIQRCLVYTTDSR